MKRLLKSFQITSGVFGVFVSIAFALGFGVCVIFSLPFMKRLIIESIEEGSIATLPSFSPEETANFMQSFFITVAIFFIILLALAIVATILSFINKPKDPHNLFVGNIVFGILSLNLFSVATGIIGLVAYDKGYLYNSFNGQ